MKLFKNKQFVLFLILTVIVYSFSVQTAKASWLSDFIDDAGDAIGGAVNSIVDTVVDIGDSVSNTVSDAVNGAINAIADAGNSIGAALVDAIVFAVVYSPLGITVAVFQCSVLNQNSIILSGCDSYIDSGAVIVSVQSLECAYQIPVTFYNVGMNTNYYQAGTDCVKQLNFNETDRKIALYRYTLDGNSSNSDLNNWFNNIKNNTGDGFENIDGNGNGSLYWDSQAENSKFVEINYQTACGSSLECKFIDVTVPGDAYIAYVAKILGPYTGYALEEDDNGYYTACSLGYNDKFLARSQGQYSNFNFWNGTGREGIVGPYRTGTCPVAPATITSFYLTNPAASVVYYPDEEMTLNWVAEGSINSCDISGSLSETVSSSGSLPVSVSRGTANPGSGKTYSYTLTCSGLGGTVSKTTEVTVKKVPVCSKIEVSPTNTILPAPVTLSWDCQYVNQGNNGSTAFITNTVDSNRINLNVTGSGSNGAINGFKQFRPTKPITYILNITGLDGSIIYSTDGSSEGSIPGSILKSATGAGSTVNDVNFKPKLKEATPQ